MTPRRKPDPVRASVAFRLGSQTYRLGLLTVVLSTAVQAACLACVVGLAGNPDVLVEVFDAIGRIAAGAGMGTGIGGGIATAGYGARHWGAREPSSRLVPVSEAPGEEDP